MAQSRYGRKTRSVNATDTNQLESYKIEFDINKNPFAPLFLNWKSSLNKNKIHAIINRIILAFKNNDTSREACKELNINNKDLLKFLRENNTAYSYMHKVYDANTIRNMIEDVVFIASSRNNKNTYHEFMTLLKDKPLTDPALIKKTIHQFTSNRAQPIPDTIVKSKEEKDETIDLIDTKNDSKRKRKSSSVHDDQSSEYSELNDIEPQPAAQCKKLSQNIVDFLNTLPQEKTPKPPIERPQTLPKSTMTYFTDLSQMNTQQPYYWNGYLHNPSMMNYTDMANFYYLLNYTNWLNNMNAWLHQQAEGYNLPPLSITDTLLFMKMHDTGVIDQLTNQLLNKTNTNEPDTTTNPGITEVDQLLQYIDELSPSPTNPNQNANPTTTHTPYFNGTYPSCGQFSNPPTPPPTTPPPPIPSENDEAERFTNLRSLINRF